MNDTPLSEQTVVTPADPAQPATGVQPATDATESVGSPTSVEQEHTRRLRRIDEYSQVMRSLPPASMPLAAFLPRPSKTYFASQISGEVIVMLLRKHPITQIPWILLALVLAVIPLFIDPGAILSFLPSNYQIAITISWYAFLLTIILESFLSWYFNVYIITDERVVDVDFDSLIYRNITSAKLENIEDITAEAGGVLQTVFNYGTVIIQTAGAVDRIEFEQVPNPNLLIKLLNELLQEEEQEKIEGRVN